MASLSGPPVGLVLGSTIPPEETTEAARVADTLGYRELWVGEDYFFTAGISSVTAALGATHRISVGTGIVSALVRHPAVLAMELATISRMYPGRLRIGIALGAPHWLRQMGLYPGSPLNAVQECVTSVRSLLRGRQLTHKGTTFIFDRIQLGYPLVEEVPIYIGAVAPKMLQLSGAIADGNLLPILASPEFVRSARQEISIGATNAGRTGHHPIVVFVFFSVDFDSKQAKERARKAMAFYLFHSRKLSPMFESYDISDELRDMALRGGPEAIDREMPEKWTEDLAVVGDPEECAQKISYYLTAGADVVGLLPMPTGSAQRMIELAAEEVFPRLP